MRDRAMQGKGERDPHDSGFGRKKREGKGGSCKHPDDQLSFTVYNTNSCGKLTELATRLVKRGYSSRVQVEVIRVKSEFRVSI